MKVLFVSAGASHDNNSCNHRLRNLKRGLEKSGVLTKILYVGDYFFKSPCLIQALNIPLLQEQIDGYDAIHGGDSACHVLGMMKHLKDFTLINDVDGSIEEHRLLIKNCFDLAGYYIFFQGWIMEKIANRYSDFFVTCSGPLKQCLIYNGIDENRIEVIRNAVDTELFKPQKNISRSGDNFVVTYAGAFQKWQSIENLIEAAKLIKNNNIKFKIIGFKKEDQVLKEKIKRILGNRAELTDALPRNGLVDELCLSDVLIIPRSRHPAMEVAFPTKFAEYIATGKPVIVTNVDETASFVKKYNCGFVCEPYAESIAKTIIEAKGTPSIKLLNMGKNGRQLAESQFDQRIIGRKYFNFLRKVLSESWLGNG